VSCELVRIEISPSTAARPPAPAINHPTPDTACAWTVALEACRESWSQCVVLFDDVGPQEFAACSAGTAQN